MLTRRLRRRTNNNPTLVLLLVRQGILFRRWSHTGSMVGQHLVFSGAFCSLSGEQVPGGICAEARPESLCNRHIPPQINPLALRFHWNFQVHRTVWHQGKEERYTITKKENISTSEICHPMHARTRQSANIVSMSVYHLRHWPNIKTTLGRNS